MNGECTTGGAMWAWDPGRAQNIERQLGAKIVGRNGTMGLVLYLCVSGEQHYE